MTLPQQRATNALNRRMGVQESKTQGPSLGEFYGQLLGFPAIRGVWYPGSLDQTGAMYDQSGQGRTLTYQGNPFTGNHNDLVPYMAYDGTGDYHSRADEAGLDIIGNEGYVALSNRGLTFGGVFWWNNNTGTQTVISKATPGDIAYYIRNNAGTLECSISNTGLAVLTASLTGLVANTWNIVIGRYMPSAEVKLWNNGVTAVNTAAIPATLKNSAARFLLAGEDNGGALNNPLTGRIAMGFLAAAAWPDALIDYLTARSRPMFGV